MLSFSLSRATLRSPPSGSDVGRSTNLLSLDSKTWLWKGGYTSLASPLLGAVSGGSPRVSSTSWLIGSFAGSIRSSTLVGVGSSSFCVVGGGNPRVSFVDPLVQPWRFYGRVFGHLGLDRVCLGGAVVDLASGDDEICSVLACIRDRTGIGVRNNRGCLDQFWCLHRRRWW